MAATGNADCKECVHFRSSPYGAGRTGCYFPANMPGRQKELFLDEQQVPGECERINVNGDCKDFEARRSRKSLLQRLFSLGE